MYKRISVYRVINNLIEDVYEYVFNNIKEDRIAIDLMRIFEELKYNYDVELFISKLPLIKKKLQLDLDFFIKEDPACKGEEEVVYSYPGFYAIVCYRIAHELVDFGILARIISEYAHSKTGIDIHPEAKIGVNFMIDHGSGVVIGQTTVIGNYVKIFQGVTLGAYIFKKGLKRHPTIGDNVTIYANAIILGDIYIKDNSIIKCNSIIRERG